jgi:hypothetical protein
MYGAALLLGRAPDVRHLRARRIEAVGNAAIPAQADVALMWCRAFARRRAIDFYRYGCGSMRWRPRRRLS